ncbi:MAG: DPP IV N-terminal domain-containing protein [Phocaeicola sp.]
MRKSILLFFTLTLCSSIMAQEKKSFTLEELLPGGSNYFNMLPKNLYGLQWWGDVAVHADIHTVKSIHPTTGKEIVITTLDEVNEAIVSANESFQLKTELKQLHQLRGAKFPWADQPVFTFQQSNYMVWYNFKEKRVTNLFYLTGAPQGIDFCAANGTVAYTDGDNLRIASKGEESTLINPIGESTPKGIVYGQSVHRDEFGIHKGTFWSPKGSSLAFYRMDQSMVTDYPQVNTTTRTATLEPDKYPMAGMTSHKVTIGVYNLATAKTTYLQTGDVTDRYFTNISWSPDEKNIFVIELNRAQNHAQLVRYNAETGAKEAVLIEEKHEKYVEPQNPITFLPWDSNLFIYQSQQDGYNHLYLYNSAGELQKQLTKGEWLVQDLLGFNKDTKEVIIKSTEISPLQGNIFSVQISTGKRTLIGESNANHNVQLSTTGKYLIDNYSSHTIARNIAIIPTNGKSKKVVTLLEATNPMEAYNMPEITVGTLKAADGETELYYRLIKPVDFDPNKKYPAIIYVYGGPHAQMITNVRDYGARGWDIYMAQKGYVMLTVDNRGSSNRGLEFENCTHYQLGTEEMKDQLQGVELLKSLPYVDINRLGVHGWSYGGFMTTNLMLTYPDTFKVGVAGGPVIDWNYYEVMYGERYMGTAETNPEGFKNADLKLRAGNLKGRLQLIIGANDPVCVPQHAVTFLRACIDAGTHPDYFIYPEAGHNMVGRDRIHLHERITRYFEDNLK